MIQGSIIIVFSFDGRRRFFMDLLFELGRVAYNDGSGAFDGLEGLIRCSEIKKMSTAMSHNLELGVINHIRKFRGSYDSLKFFHQIELFL